MKREVLQGTGALAGAPSLLARDWGTGSSVALLAGWGCGRLDPAGPRGHADRCADPGCRLSIYPGAPHGLVLAHAPLLAAELAVFAGA